MQSGSDPKKKKLGTSPSSMRAKECPRKKDYLSGERICPDKISGKESVADLVDKTFSAYNSARLREACRLYTEKMLEDDVTVGMSLAGALTPAGLGASAIVPLIEAGFVDWIVSTGANLYHDLHFAFNLPLYSGSPSVDDTDLRENEIIRIYDVLLDYRDLLGTDRILYKIISGEEFQKEMGTSELHYLLGKYADEGEKKTGARGKSLLAAAFRCGVPVFTSSPGDSTIGMNIAALEIQGNKLKINPSTDVTESSAIVLDAKRGGGKSAAVLMGGGSPKNFILQTEPQIQEILALEEFGHDYFLQITDARPDTGGLSGATPHEAVSWGKVDPSGLPDAVVAYVDTTIAMPILANYMLAKHKKRKPKKLYVKLNEIVSALKQEYFVKNKPR